MTTVVPLTEAQREALVRFFADLSEGDRLRDLMVLAHHVDETWAGMAAVGLLEVLDTP